MKETGFSVLNPNVSAVKKAHLTILCQFEGLSFHEDILYTYFRIDDMFQKSATEIGSLHLSGLSGTQLLNMIKCSL